MQRAPRPSARLCGMDMNVIYNTFGPPILRQFVPMKLDFEHSPDFPGLSPILRVLLVTDGTVTKTLEAYFGEAIEVDVLEHAERTSESPYPAIGIAVGDH